MRSAVSHRARSFLDDAQQVRERLCELVGARRVELLLGSGTLANDAIGAQLSVRGERGLIVSNGEFGDRLREHAKRFALSFDSISAPWGKAIPYGEIRATLAANRDVRWLWAVHCETSTGVLSDLDSLKGISGEQGVRLCLDAVSSIGTAPVDLGGVFLASGVSGKGLGSFPGLAMVFYHHEISPSPQIPRYLDLGIYASSQGVPFSQSSNLVYALDAALDRFHTEHGAAGSDQLFARTENLARWLRSELGRLGLRVLAPESVASPAVLTVVLPPELDSTALGASCERKGFLLSYRSEYLAERNLFQICLMAEHTRAEIAPLIEHLGVLTAKQASPV